VLKVSPIKSIILLLIFINLLSPFELKLLSLILNNSVFDLSEANIIPLVVSCIVNAAALFSVPPYISIAYNLEAVNVAALIEASVIIEPVK